MNRLVIIGASGHGRVVADIVQKLNNYSEIVFLDDGEITESMGIPVVGKVADVDKYLCDSDIFVAIGNCQVRETLINRLLLTNAFIPTMIHPNATVGASVELGAGTVVMAGAVINPCTKIGKGVIINTCSSVDHDCLIGDCVHIAVGAHLAGAVCIGEKTWVGAGATVSNNVSICASCMIGAGAVVIKDIAESGTYIGVPAKRK